MSKALAALDAASRGEDLTDSDDDDDAALEPNVGDNLPTQFPGHKENLNTNKITITVAIEISVTYENKYGE